RPVPQPRLNYVHDLDGRRFRLPDWSSRLCGQVFQPRLDCVHGMVILPAPEDPEQLDIEAWGCTIVRPRSQRTDECARAGPRKAGQALFTQAPERTREQLAGE